jgi:23S rRNA (uracil747-C5)-methyltransferase
MPSLRPRRAQVLDMFPQTTHYEVLTLLQRG